MLSNKEIIEGLFSDLEQQYKEDVEFMLERYLEQNPDRQIAWSAWFEGATGKALDDAEFKGVIYKKENHVETNESN